MTRLCISAVGGSHIREPLFGFFYLLINEECDVIVHVIKQALAREERLAHGCNIREKAEPVLKGVGSLPEQHAEAVLSGTTASGSLVADGGVVGDDIVDKLAGAQPFRGEGHGIAGAKTERGCVDDEVCLCNGVLQSIISIGTGGDLSGAMRGKSAAQLR